MNIRQARETDAEPISELILRLRNFFISEPDSGEVAHFLETLTPEATAARIQSENYACHVAEDNGEILGVIAVRDGSHLYHLFVDPSAHRQGIGRSLWEHARGFLGGHEFTVNSSIFAVPFYQRLGFEATDVVQRQDGLEFLPMAYHDNE